MDESYTNRPNYHHYPDYAHSDGGSVTPPPSPSSSSSIVSLASNNSSASSSNDNISYYLLETPQQAPSQPQQQQKTQYKSAGATKLETEDVETELSKDFNCNLSLNDTTSTPSLADEIEDDDVVSNHNRLKLKADEYEQSQQLLQQQQIDQQRLAVLSFEQVNKLNDVMNESVSIHGRGNFPTLEVRLKDFVTLVREKLELDIQEGGAGMCVKDIRLNGGAASHVLAYEAQCYNDLDLIFAVEFSSNRHFDRVKSAVLNTISDLLPDHVMRKRISTGSLKEAYVGKMVKVNNDGDRWSLISLGNSPGHKNVELKFVDTMRRQFEFSVDSFQIILDSLLLFYDCAELPISENFYPTVVGESVYGDFHEALYHLTNKLISTRRPEEIRGGGLLKYCNLLVRNYIPVDQKMIKKLERYMCSRFFIDFPDILQQRIKLEAYLRNHFWGVEEEPLQYHYLVHLHEVVENSTVCLMGHERRQTLSLIEHLAVQVSCRERQKMQSLQPQQLMLSPSHQHHPQMNHQTQQQHSQSHHHHHQIQYQNDAQMVQQSQLHLQPPPPANVQSTHSMQSNVTQPQSITATTTSTVTPQQIQLQPTTQPGLLYANGVYYAPVTICTCGNQNYMMSTWSEPSSYTGYQQMSTNYNHTIDSSYTKSYANNQSIMSHQETDVKCSHNPSSTTSTTTSNINNSINKKHVKFSKSLTTVRKSSSKKWRMTSKDTPTTTTMPTTNAVTSAKMGKAAPAESPYYYYYYYNNNNETLQPPPAMNDEQQQQQQQQVYNNNVAGNYFYYYTIDGTSDANYNEFYVQPAGNNENYNSQRIINNWRWF